MTLAIIQMHHPKTGQNWRWETGDGKLLSGRVQLQGGKLASTLDIEVADHRLELANTLPLPTRHARIDIECWLGRTNKPPKVFAGFVSQLTASGAPGRLRIMAVDRSKSMRRVPLSRNLTAGTPGDVLRRLCEPYGIRVDLRRANLDDVQFAQVLQQGETDAEVVNRLIGEVGHIGWFENDVLYIIERGKTRDDGPGIRLLYGTNIKTYSFAIDELTRETTPNLFDVDGAQVAEFDDIEATDQPSELSRSAGLLLTYASFPSYTKEQVEKVKKSQARAQKIFRASIESTDCFAGASLDDAVILEGVGKRFSGVWLIDSLTHDLVDGHTSFELYNSGSAA